MSNQEYRKTDAHDLYVCINKFIQDNDHSIDVELRWLATKAEPLRVLVRDWKGGGMESLSQAEHQSLADFRLQEIAVEQSKLDKAKAALESEAKKIMGKKQAA